MGVDGGFFHFHEKYQWRRGMLCKPLGLQHAAAPLEVQMQWISPHLKQV